jgi:uncharacterized protein with HEPN domain
VKRLNHLLQECLLPILSKIPKQLKQFCIKRAIMGEAAGQLLPEVESLYPEIPWVDMRAIRNVIIHEYFQVNLSITWQTIKTDLPPLIKQLQELLENS